jgi:hypothetical protein
MLTVRGQAGRSTRFLGQANQHQNGEDDVYQQTRDHTPAPSSHARHPLSSREWSTAYYVTAPAPVGALPSYQKRCSVSICRFSPIQAKGGAILPNKPQPGALLEERHSPEQDQPGALLEEHHSPGKHGTSGSGARSRDCPSYLSAGQ